MEEPEGKNKIRIADICYIRGDNNEYYHIYATEIGIEIPDFDITIPWDRIEEAKRLTIRR
jgi:hypothetical protein